jgi:23S rRNA pseudouridine1911/1915/1917 synthase
MSLQVVVNFRVVDETGDWVVVDKPAPLIVHPANNKPEPTLLGGLENLYSYELENGACLGIITRLDRETSGLVLVAKHTAAARELGMIFERREARKQYLAIVTGWPSEDEWVCDAPIIRAGEIRPSQIWVRQVMREASNVLLNS